MSALVAAAPAEGTQAAAAAPVAGNAPAAAPSGAFIGALVAAAPAAEAQAATQAGNVPATVPAGAPTGAAAAAAPAAERGAPAATVRAGDARATVTNVLEARAATMTDAARLFLAGVSPCAARQCTSSLIPTPFSQNSVNP